MSENSDINESGIDIIDDKKVIIDQNFSYSFDRVFGPESTQVFSLLCRKIYTKRQQSS